MVAKYASVSHIFPHKVTHKDDNILTAYGQGNDKAACGRRLLVLES